MNKEKPLLFYVLWILVQIAVFFESQIADILGLDVKSGRHEPFKGIAPEPVDAYFHRIKYQILRDTNIFEMEAAFMDNLTAGGLLGQEGFFDNFTVKFERRSNKFEVTPVRP